MLRFDTWLQAERSVAGVLQPLITLWALRQVECTMGWLLTEGLIPISFAKEVPHHIRCSLPTPLRVVAGLGEEHLTM